MSSQNFVLSKIPCKDLNLNHLNKSELVVLHQNIAPLHDKMSFFPTRLDSRNSLCGHWASCNNSNSKRQSTPYVYKNLPTPGENVLRVVQFSPYLKLTKQRRIRL